MNLVYVIGDSQVRAFSYHENFLTFFIGGSGFNNFLTEKKAKTTHQRVISFNSQLDASVPLLLSLCGDATHHALNTFKTQAKGDVVLTESAKRYLELIKELHNMRKAGVVVSSAISSDINDDNYHSYKFYNDQLKELCGLEGIPYLDLFEEIIENKRTKAKYQADFVHLNQSILPPIIDELIKFGKLKEPISTNTNFEKAYTYNIPSKYGVYRVWGDFPKEKLQLGGKKALKFTQKLHKRTNSHKAHLDLIKLLLPTLEKELKTKPRLLVLNCKEGYIPFYLPADSFSKIVGIDPSQARIAVAKQLAAIQDLRHIEFYSAEKPFEASKDDFDLIIDLESNQSEELDPEFIRNLKEHSKVFIYLSHNAAASQKQLRASGYKHIDHISLLKNDELFKEDTKLLICFNNKPSYVWNFFYKKWNFINLSNYWLNKLKSLKDKPQKAIDGYKMKKKNRQIKKYTDKKLTK